MKAEAELGASLLVGCCALALAVSACGPGDGAALDIPAGDTAAFCARWPEARVALQEDFERDNEWNMRSAVDVTRRTLDEIEPFVPAALRSEWDAAVGFPNTAMTLIEIASYEPSRLRRELLDAAFGEGGVEAAVAASRAAIGELDAWAVEECGGFCTMWPRFDRALEFDPSDDSMILIRGEADEVLIRQGEAMVPEAVRRDWDAAASMKLALIDLYRSWDWEPRWHEPGSHGLEEQIFQADTVREHYSNRGESLQDVGPRELAALYSMESREAIDAWAAANCESVGISGMPGTVDVEGGPLDAGGTLLMAALPSGFDPAGIEDASDFLGVACTEWNHAWDPFELPLLERERDFADPCTALHMEHQGASVAVIPAGEYELLVARFPNGTGRFGLYVPAPSECVIEPFTVDGDTTVTVPELGPCSLGPLDGSAEEVERRTPLPAPTGPSGTLELAISEYPREDRDGILRVAVLPRGTTLDQLYLGEAWPVGAGCLHLPRWDTIDDPNQRGRLAEGVKVPIGAFPATSGGVQCTPVWEIDLVETAPVRLAEGEYDVYVVAEYFWEERDAFFCGATTVFVSGASTFEVPPLEECTW